MRIPRSRHAPGLSNRHPARCESVKTMISLEAFVPSERARVAIPRASCARKVPPTGARLSSTPSTSARCVSGAAVTGSGAGPPRTTVNAVPRGDSLTTRFASAMAASKPVLPSRRSCIEVEASMTSATSLRPDASKRLRFTYFSNSTRPAARRRTASDMPRTVQRAFLLLRTNDPPNRAIPRSAAGRTKSHGTEESGVTNGRAMASAISPTSRQRAAMSRRSSHSIFLRRTEMVSKRKRIAPHSTGLAACWRTRWIRMGMETPTSPSSNHGLRNNIKNS